MNIYQSKLDLLKRFMSLEVQNNLIWGGCEEFSTMLFKEAGFTVANWSWYDGPIVNLDYFHCITVNYAACANAYTFNFENMFIMVEEVKKDTIDFTSKLFLKTYLPGTSHYDYIEYTKEFNPSLDFINFQKDLESWAKSFDFDEYLNYTASIYIDNEDIIHEL